MLQVPAAAKTPEWGVRMGADGKKYDGAGPKGWRGVGEWQEDWGELNAGAAPPEACADSCVEKSS